jgi:gliding motility-associated-like protein
MFRARHFLSFCALLFMTVGAIGQNPIEIIRDSDTIQVCKGSSISLEASFADSYSWRPSNWIDNPTQAIVNVTPTSSGYVSVDAITEGVTSSDSIYISLVEATVAIISSGNEFPVCEGESIQLLSNVSPEGGSFSWRTLSEMVGNNESSVTIKAPRGGVVMLDYRINNCTFSDTVELDVIDFGVPEILTQDTLVCQGQQFRLASNPGQSTTIYAWTPSDFLSADDVANPLFTATANVSYNLLIESDNGECREEFDISIRVTPITLQLNIPDIVELCLGDSVNITATINGSPVGFSWGPNDGVLSSLTDLSITAKPEYTNFYFARYELDGCILIDSFLLKVDSLPENREINVVPFKEEYCPGEEISLFSGMYEGILYVDIEHLWRPANNSIRSDLDGYNLFIETTETTTYIRRTTNGACTVEDSIEIIVIDPVIELNLEDTLICPGEPVQLMVLNDVDDISWSPETGLSCTDCENPIATVFQNTVYTVSGEVDGCPAAASVRILTYPLPLLSFELLNVDDLYLGDQFSIRVVGFPDLPEDAMVTWVYNGQNQSETSTTLSDIFADNPVNTISVTYITEDGCPITITGNLQALEPEYDIPNAFSPDGDENNDIFRAVVRGAVEVQEIQVYNRWGQRVFNGTDNSGWDGTFNGEDCPPEVYAYRIVLRLPNGRTFLERGDLTLLR